MALSTIFPSSPIFSPLQKSFFSAPFIPSSIALHSHLFCSISSSLTVSDSKLAAKLGQEQENEISTEKNSIFLLQSFPIPRLSIKEKKELASYAHSLGKKLKSQQVGKSGVTPAVSAAMVEAFEANELLKRFPIPKLSIKEKKELASYAHSLGKKLKSQQVGKSGVTPAVSTAMVEAFKANELLKLKVHGSCPGELSDVIKQLENTTGSAVVGQIGRTVILYRPSLTKMKKNDSYSSRKQQQTKPVKSTTVLNTSKSKQVTRTSRRSQQ